MPELPELLYFKQYLDATSLNQPIQAVTVHNIKILNDTSESDLRESLVGRSFVSTLQHGKYLFLQTGDNREVELHFGMTGRPVYYEHEESKPEYPRLVFDFENGGHLAFDCMRMLGEVGLIEDHEEFIRQKGLGPDPITGDISFPRFCELIEDSRGMIKTTLMDQSRIAGIGNECSEEILFQARIHPKTKVRDLTETALRKIYDTMREVVETKAKTVGSPNLIPDHWILSHREDGADCPKCGGEIKRIEVSGRGTYICPNCQEM